MVKLASVRSFIDLSKTYFCLSSPTEPLYVRMLSHINFTTLKMSVPVRSLAPFSPTGPVAVEEIPIKPGVIVAVDQLVFQYMSGALRGCAGAVSEG